MNTHLTQTQNNKEEKEMDTIVPIGLKKFIEGMLFEAELVTNDDELNQRIIGEIYLRLAAYLNSRVINFVPENKLEELEELLNANADSHILDIFITTNIPNYTAVYATILLEFKSLYLGKPPYTNIADLPNTIKTKVQNANDR